MPDVGRPQDRDPECRGAGVHRHGAARRLEPHRRSTEHQGLVGNGAQRDGPSRARGLPGPAAHLGRTYPDRQGLPLLRRSPDVARPSRHRHHQAGRRVLLRRTRAARGDAAPDVESARLAHQQRRRRGRSTRRGRARAASAARVAVVDCRHRRGRVRERHRRERDRSSCSRATTTSSCRLPAPTCRRCSMVVCSARSCDITPTGDAVGRPAVRRLRSQRCVPQ